MKLGDHWRIKEIVQESSPQYTVSIEGTEFKPLIPLTLEPDITMTLTTNSIMSGLKEFSPQAISKMIRENYVLVEVPEIHWGAAFEAPKTILDLFRSMSTEELATTLHGFCPYDCFAYCTKCDTEQDCVKCRKEYFEKEQEQ